MSGVVDVLAITPQRLTWYLWQAVEADDGDAAARLVERGASLSLKDSDGLHALDKAASSGKAQACRALITAGNYAANPNFLTDALRLAAVNGHADAVRELLQGGARPDQAIADTVAGMTVVSTEVVKLLLTNFDQEIEPARQRTFVLRAGRQFDPEFMTLLIERGCELLLRQQAREMAKLASSGFHADQSKKSDKAKEYQGFFAALDARCAAQMTLTDAARSEAAQP